MFTVFRSGYRAVANAVWSLVAIASRTVNVTHFNGNAAPAQDQAGYPKVDTVYHRGSLENGIIGGRRDVSLGAIGANAVATQNVAGYLPIDLVKIEGAAMATHVAGYLPADTRYHRNTEENILVSGRRDVSVGHMQVNVTVGSNLDKTGYSVSSVGDKTGYTLTAGSYSVRASGVQRGVLNAAATGAADTEDATISAVTMSRALAHHQGQRTGGSGVQDSELTLELVGTTTIRVTRVGTTGAGVVSYEVEELF